MKKEMWTVVGDKPELVTLLDGTVASMPPGQDPVQLRLDARFSRLRRLGRLRRVMVDVDEPAAPAPTPPLTNAPAPAPAREEETVAVVMEDDNGNEAAESVYAEDVPVSELGLNSTTEELLRDNGFESLADLMDASDEDLLAIDGIGPSRLKDVRGAVSDFE